MAEYPSEARQGIQVSRPFASRLPAHGASVPGSRRVAVCCLIGVITALASAASAQAPLRRLTTIEAVKQFPPYFHLQNVVVRGEFVERGTELLLATDTADLRLLDPSQAKRGPVEVRGQVIDIGRLDRNDSRLGTYAERRGSAPWPPPGAEVVLSVTAVTEAQPATRANIRALALEPRKFDGQKVTVVGNFRGRNLFGDLPEAPGKSRYDFVLVGAEGAVWITGMRPRGKGFDLDVERRRDTNRWLEVSGVVSLTRGMPIVTATAIVSAPEPEASAPPAEDDVLPPDRLEVVFSAPVADATDISPTAPARIQFSRGLREGSLEGQVRASYLGAQPTDPPLEFKVSYDAATRAVTIAFARPLDAFRTVRVELLSGITAFDGGTFEPFTLTYSVGNR